MLDHNGRVPRCSTSGAATAEAAPVRVGDGRSFLIQVRRLAAYLQAGLLVPAEEEKRSRCAPRARRWRSSTPIRNGC
jgi:hypothetical protein